MAELARTVPVAVLADALGTTDVDAATAGLIGNTLRAGAGPPPVTVVRTLRVTPAGDRRAVDLAAADPSIPFGAGRHRCPGEAHALALAAGVLDALDAAGAVVIDAPETDEPRPNLRIPTRLVVRLPPVGRASTGGLPWR